MTARSLKKGAMFGTVIPRGMPHPQDAAAFEASKMSVGCP